MAELAGEPVRAAQHLTVHDDAGPDPDLTRDVDEAAVPRAVAALPWAALGLLLLTAVYTAWDRPGWQASGRLTADGVLTALIAVQGALVLGLALASGKGQGA